MKPRTLTIGLVLDDTLDSTDGVQQYVLTLGDWLADQGHDVHYLVGQTKRNDRPNIHSMGTNIAVRFNKNRLSIPLPVSASRVDTILAEHQFDVLHVQMPYSPQLAGKLIRAASSKTAVVGTFHILPASLSARLGTFMLGKATHSINKRFDAVCAVSQPAQLYMQQTFGIAATVIPNAIDVQAMRADSLSPKHKANSIIFLGRLVERKGAHYLLQAFAQCKRRADMHLTIAGNGPMRPRLEHMATQLGIARQVRFLGFVPESKKARLLASADIAVFPSTGGESFGIVLVEAIASRAGVVLAGDNPGYSSVITDSQQLIDPRDTITFSHKLDQLIGDEVLRKQIHISQQKLLSQYDIKTVGHQIATLYTTALRNRKKRG